MITIKNSRHGDFSLIEMKITNEGQELSDHMINTHVTEYEINTINYRIS